MVFCNREQELLSYIEELVTILILIDGFLQYPAAASKKKKQKSHNPYFNRWFSAIDYEKI